MSDIDHDKHLLLHEELAEKYVAQTREELRIERWHATYNAAVTGLLANPSFNAYLARDVRENATQIACVTHGELVHP